MGTPVPGCPRMRRLMKSGRTQFAPTRKVQSTSRGDLWSPANTDAQKRTPRRGVPTAALIGCENNPSEFCRRQNPPPLDRGGYEGAASVGHICRDTRPRVSADTNTQKRTPRRGVPTAALIGCEDNPSGFAEDKTHRLYEITEVKHISPILIFCEIFVQICLYGAYFYGVIENCFSR